MCNREKERKVFCTWIAVLESHPQSTLVLFGSNFLVFFLIFQVVVTVTGPGEDHTHMYIYIDYIYIYILFYY